MHLSLKELYDHHVEEADLVDPDDRGFHDQAVRLLDHLGANVEQEAFPTDPALNPLGKIIAHGLMRMGYEGSDEQIKAVIEDAMDMLSPADADYPINCRIDLLEPGKLTEGVDSLRLPAAPLPGEGLIRGDEKYKVHARVHLVDEHGAYCMALACERVGPPKPNIVKAPASAIDQLNRTPGGIILNGGR